MALRYESARGLPARKEEVGGAMMWKKLGQTTRSFWMPTSPSRDDVVDDGGWEDVVDGAQVLDDGGIDSGGDRQEAYDAEYNILPPPQEEGAGYAKEAHYAEYAVGQGVDDRSAMSYGM